jgi:hypothetical protein
MPLRRQFVSGLDETPTLSIVNESAQWLDSVDEAEFEFAVDSGEPDIHDSGSAKTGKERR